MNKGSNSVEHEIITLTDIVLRVSDLFLHMFSDTSSPQVITYMCHQTTVWKKDLEREKCSYQIV